MHSVCCAWGEEGRLGAERASTPAGRRSCSAPVLPAHKQTWFAGSGHCLRSLFFSFLFFSGLPCLGRPRALGGLGAVPLSVCTWTSPFTTIPHCSAAHPAAPCTCRKAAWQRLRRPWRTTSSGAQSSWTWNSMRRSSGSWRGSSAGHSSSSSSSSSTEAGAAPTEQVGHYKPFLPGMALGYQGEAARGEQVGTATPDSPGLAGAGYWAESVPVLIGDKATICLFA